MSNPKPKPRRPIFRAKNLLKIVKGKSLILLPKLSEHKARLMGFKNQTAMIRALATGEELVEEQPEENP